MIVESPDADGRALTTLEATLLPKEVRRFVTGAGAFRHEASAVHNHWLFEHPRLMYLQAEAIDEPIAFAQAVAGAIETLIVRPVAAPSTT